MDVHTLMSAVCARGLTVVVILETDLPVGHADLDAVREVILVAWKGRCKFGKYSGFRSP